MEIDINFSFNFFKSYHHDRFLLNIHISWLLSIMFWVNKLKVSLCNDQRNHDFSSILGKCLPHTDSFTPKKWSEAERTSLLTIWSEEVRTFWVESFRDELVMILPFVYVMMKSMDIDLDHMVISYFYSTNFNRFSHHESRSSFERGINSEWFIDNHIQIV